MDHSWKITHCKQRIKQSKINKKKIKNPKNRENKQLNERLIIFFFG